MGWNYLDAVYAIGLGTFQLLDEEDYRQAQNKAKGILNIISGVQMFLLSYNPAFAAAMGLTGGAALAAPSFALAMACDLVTASIDFYNSNKEVNFEGWLEERAKEVSYNQNRISKISKKIETLDKNNEEQALEIRYLEAKIRTLNKKIDDIQDDIYARSRAYCQNDIFEKEKREKRVEKILNTHNPIKDNNKKVARKRELTRLLGTLVSMEG